MSGRLKEFINNIKTQIPKTITIEAVYEEDFVKLMKNIECEKDLVEGKLICSECGERIEKSEDITIVYSESGEIKFCCNSALCAISIIGRVTK